MPAMRNVLGVLLAGGQGERLWPLTRDRAKPAVPFGGVYRIIDVTLSNCLNSDLRRVFVLTQYKALSLNRHVRRGWSVLMGLGEFIEVLPPQMRVSQHWYLGTADAVYQNIYSIGSEQSNYVFILSGDHIYKMNYQKMLEQHIAAGADVTVATLEIDAAEAAKRFGVIETDRDWRIVGFEEKPAHPKVSPIHPGKVNASMGVYLFNTQLLVPILIADAEDPTSSHDFGKDVIPRIISKYRVFAYNFQDENKKETSYWRDVGTIDAYHEANMDLVSVSPVFNLYDKSWPLHTWQQQYPPAKFVFADPERMGTAVDSTVCGGSIISGGRVERCILGYDVRVNSYSEVEDSIIFNHVNVGRSSRIRRAIIDRHVSIPEGTVIGYDVEADRARFSVSENGVVVVVRPESMLEEPVLITGETGTGKELVARALHDRSAQRAMPFVKVNCAAIPEALLESELFGHLKGAFTGAIGVRRGKFALANRGSIFLDEIATLGTALQAKLLRVLQEREIEPLGADRTEAIDVRVIAATNRDLAQLVAEGRFQDDLFYRLHVVPITMPPLRERAEDIPMLARYFVIKHAQRSGRSVDTIEDTALSSLEAYHWPGNIRELENTIERAVVLTKGPTITREAITFNAATPRATDVPSLKLRQNVEWMERETIRRALAISRVKHQAASLMGISPRALSHYLAKYPLIGKPEAPS